MIRTALIGFGLAGRVFHGPLIATTPGMRIATVVTSDPERQARAAQEHPGAAVVPGVDDFDLLARDHDLVVVATANRHHVPLARAAIEAGLAVVVEKPMAPTAAQARDLVALARNRGCLLTVFHNRRWDADILTLQRLLAEDRLGPVARVESRIDRWRPEVSTRWRESPDPQDAGGLLLDLGTHLVDQALHLFGRPSHVYAEVGRRRAGAAVDDDDFIALQHAGGVSVHLWATSIAAAAGPRLRVLGLRGSFVKQAVDGQEDALRSGARPDAAEWGREPPQQWGLLTDSAGTHPVESEPGAWPRFYELLGAAMRGGGPAPVAPDDAVAVLEVIEAGREAARLRSVMPVGAAPSPHPG